jgi:uncharacterized membrane-anchored protein
VTTNPQLALIADTYPMLNKVPEVTVYFWLIKVLCTTVGESFADYINETLGFGLTNTTTVFSVALIAVLAVQFRLRRYVPFVYWLAVVLISVVGTLLTDNLTDGHDVPLWISTTVFTVLLAVVFAIWYYRERTLSIHSIVTTPRESFYWLTVLVTFALGTAAGDWTLDLTGWTPGPAVLLPAGLIAVILVAWKLGAGPVLSFWLAYILTRPLGANIGDYLGLSHDEGGLGLGTMGTSLIFLTAILGAVIFLTLTRKDRTENAYHGTNCGRYCGKPPTTSRSTRRPPWKRRTDRPTPRAHKTIRRHTRSTINQNRRPERIGGSGLSQPLQQGLMRQVHR